MDENIKVSVIVTVYNLEEYVGQCLDSLINQTLREIEIICVDDQSTDGSHDILKEYEKKDNRIKVVRQDHAGAGAARNNGISLASGEYLSILDADDFFELDMLEKAYNNASSTNADIVIFRSDFFNNDTKSFEENSWSIIPERIPSPVFCADDIPDKIFNIGAGWAWDKLFRRKFVLNSGVKFQEIRTTNDMFFVLYLYTKADKISFLNEVLAHQRIKITDSLSVTREKSWDNVYLALYRLKESLIEDGSYDKFRQSFVNWALNLLLWHIDTLSKDESDKLRQKCYKEFFQNLDICKNSNEYFYKYEEYSRMIEIMEGDVKVSVIVPVYNAREYLTQCLNSICSQTLRNIEIICVNDGSTDDSLKILRDYQQRDYRIHIIDRVHSNAGDARNEGLKIASGEYLSFLDADDFFEEDMLEKACLRAKENDAEICIFGSDQYNQKESRFIQTPWTLKVWDMPEKSPFLAEDIPDKIFNISSPAAWNKIFKREFVFEKDIEFQSNYVSNDMFFVYALLASAERIVTIEEVFVHQRVEHSKTFATEVECFAMNFYYALIELRSFLVKVGKYEVYKKSYVNWALDFSLFNLHRFSDSIYALIRQNLKLHGFSEMDICEMSEENFYNQDQYNEMIEILNDRISPTTENPEVSIIFPVERYDDCTRPSLESLTGQMLENIEIIIVEYGDKKSAVKNEYISNDARIKKIYNYDSDYAKSVKKALDIAQGKYIGLVNPCMHIDNAVLIEMTDKMEAKESLDLIVAGLKDVDNVLQKENIIFAICKIDIIRKGINSLSNIYYQDIAYDTFVAYILDISNDVFVLDSNIYRIKKLDIKEENERPNHIYVKDCKESLLFCTKNINKDSNKKAIYKRTLEIIKEILNSKEYCSEKEKIQPVIKDIIAQIPKVTLGNDIFSTDDYKLYTAFSHENEKNSYSANVSIIVPVYNASQFIEECMDSIVSQTLRDIEIICIDDGSSDNSRYYINRYSAEDCRIKVICQEKNGGYGKAMNTGLDHASGKYIGIVEPDDYISPFMYKTLYETAALHNLDICKSDMFRFYSTRAGDVDMEYVAISRSNDDYNIKMSAKERRDIWRMTMNTVPAIYKSSMIKKNNIRYNETPGASYQDNGFMMQTLACADSMMFVKKGFYYIRRDNPNSSVSSSGKVYCMDNEYEFIKRWLKSNGHWEKLKEIWAMLLFRNEMFTIDRIGMNFKKEYIYYIANKWKDIIADEKLELSDFLEDEKKRLYYIMSEADNFLRDVIKRSSATNNKKFGLIKKVNDFEKENIRLKKENHDLELLINSFLAQKNNGEREKTESPKVSVIVPVYNAGKYIEESIRSISSQTLKEIEIICIDDGSVDDSLSKLNVLSAMDPRIIVVHQENKGAGAARNAGLDLARGEYLSFLDADDFFEADMLEKMYEVGVNTEAKVVVCDVDFYYEDIKKYIKVDWASLKRYPDKETFRPEEIIYRSRFRATVGWTWDKLFKRDWILQEKIRFQEIRTHNDMVFTFGAFFCADKISKCNSILVHQRRNHGNSLSQTPELSWECLYEALSHLRELLKDKKIWSRFKLDFINYCVHLFQWAINKQQYSDNFIDLYTAMREEWMYSLDIDNMTQSDFFNENEWEWYEKFRNMNASQYLFSVLKELKNENEKLREKMMDIAIR